MAEARRGYPTGPIVFGAGQTAPLTVDEADLADDRFSRHRSSRGHCPRAARRLVPARCLHRRRSLRDSRHPRHGRHGRLQIQPLVVWFHEGSTTLFFGFVASASMLPTFLVVACCIWRHFRFAVVGVWRYWDVGGSRATAVVRPSRPSSGRPKPRPPAALRARTHGAWRATRGRLPARPRPRAPRTTLRRGSGGAARP